MIVIKIYGGLGNQLFQYAFGLNLAIHNKTNLILDLSWFNKKINKATKRSFELKYLNISTQYNNSLSIKFKLLFYNHWLLKRIPIKRKLKVYNDNDLLNLSKINNVYLDGYWHSYLYFINIRDILISEFTLKKEFEIKTEFRNKILSTSNSVSLHIRRTDYLNNPNYAKCSIFYYERAIEEFYKFNYDFTFFVFSDDLDFAKKIFKNNSKIIYSKCSNFNISNTVEDFLNITSCNNHIICNSTFSWWASWLCANPRKIIIIPDQWFTNNNYEKSKGYYLDSYLKVNND